MSTAAVPAGEERLAKVLTSSWGRLVYTCMTTTDHKVIANMHFVTSLIFFAFGGLITCWGFLPGRAGPPFDWWNTILGLGLGIWALCGWVFEFYRDDYKRYAARVRA